MIHPALRTLFISLILACNFLACSALALDRRDLASQFSSAIDRLVDVDSSTTTGILVRDLVSGKTVYQLNDQQPLKPASVLKLATTNAALARLGPGFNWQTQVTLHGFSKGHAKVVSVRGNGDPSMTTEALWVLARKIYKAGVRSIDTLVIDDSAFSEQRLRSGARAYEGGSSALAFNFNSIGFDVCPATVGKSAQVVSDPWELAIKVTGQVNTVLRQGESVSIEDRSSCDAKGCQILFEVGGTIAHDSSCIQVYRSIDRLPEYFGGVLVRLLKQLGVAGSIALRLQAAPKDGDVTLTHGSRSLPEVLTGLNNFSTNVTAEQLVYALGAEQEGAVFSYTRGLERIRESVIELGVDPQQVVVLDGSGLSHDNRLSAAAVVKILEEQYKNQRYGIEFQASLSVWGRSGTLKKRLPLSEQVAVRGKTGSLDGVSSLAGYLFRQGKHPLAFAVLQNQVASKAKAVDIEDSVVELISRSDLD